MVVDSRIGLWIMLGSIIIMVCTCLVGFLGCQWYNRRVNHKYNMRDRYRKLRERKDTLRGVIIT